MTAEEAKDTGSSMTFSMKPNAEGRGSSCKERWSCRGTIVRERTTEVFFCGKTQDQVRKLVAGPGVYICDVYRAM